jgi:hypothetical protein
MFCEFACSYLQNSQVTSGKPLIRQLSIRPGVCVVDFVSVDGIFSPRLPSQLMFMLSDQFLISFENTLYM